MKKLIALMLSRGCLLAGVAWGGQFSVDLCASVATVGARTAAKIATSPLDETSGTLCKVVRDAGAATDAPVIYSSPSEALAIALREGKVLMVMLGFDGCTYLERLKEQVMGMGKDFSSDFVLFYANTLEDSYGLDDETYTGSPYWGTFDPRVWKLENRWVEDNGRLTICHGYSEGSTTYYLGSARSKWAALNAAPTALEIGTADEIAAPTALEAKLTFPDGTETRVGNGLTWRVTSGTAAKIESGNTLCPIRGMAGGEVVVRCDGVFWNQSYSASGTIRIAEFCTVSFLPNGGSGTMPDQMVKKGGSIDLNACTFQKEGYTFKQWMGSDGKTYQDFQNVTLSADLELTAQWERMNDTFSRAQAIEGVEGSVYGTNRGAAFDANDFLRNTYGSSHTVWYKWTAPSNGLFRLEIADADFDTVVGVFTGSSAKNLNVVADDDDMGVVMAEAASGTTYYIAIGGYGDDQGDFNMNWEFFAETALATITLDAHGGNLETGAVRRNPGMEIGILPVPKRNGHRFDGWFTEADGGEPVDEYWTVPEESVTLHAHWTALLYWYKKASSALAEAKKKRKLILMICGRETCGNTIGTRDYTCEDPEVRAVLGDYVLWFCNCDTQEGDFGKYVSDRSSFSLPLVCVINPDDPQKYVGRSFGYMPVDVMLSFLKTNGPKTVKFDANGGEVSEHERTVLPKSAVGKLPTPKRGKYTFVGWYTKGSGGTKVSATTKVKANVTYYAHWAGPWTVTWNANGGELGEGVTNKVLVARNKAVGSLPTPTKAGYAFKGWYTKKSGGVKITAKTKVTGNITWYAQWTPRKYAVKVEKAGKGTVKGAGNKAYQSKVTLTAQAVKGYVFQGWYLDGEFKSSKASYSFKVPLGGVTYTARFVTVSEDKAGIGMVLAGVGVGSAAPDAANVPLPVLTNVCGVAIEPYVIETQGITPTSVSVSGLPAGLKYDTKKKSIVGTPTAIKTVTAKITVKARGASRAWSVKWVIVPIPAWAQGTFKGKGTFGGKDANVTLTVGKTGKISGKFVVVGKQYPFTSSSFAELDAEGVLRTAKGTLKYGTKTCKVEIAVTEGEAEVAVTGVVVGVGVLALP